MILEKSIYNLMNLDIIDGVIISSETIKGEEHLMHSDRCINSGVPVISIEKKIDGCYSLVYDYEETMFNIVNHFIEHHKFTK